MRHSATKWVAYLDGDDEWRSWKLECQIEAAKRNPKARFIGGDHVFIDAKGRPFAYSNGSSPLPSSWLVDRELMAEYPFNPNVTLGEDFFWLKATREFCIRVRVPRIVAGYRIRGLSLSSLQYGYTRQRHIRESMARVARISLSALHF